ncbi:hypothetical protein [Mycobacterium uberis]|uniref:hypothetical protein n=1 Tax=Mycobacterium uberis TaxID=2162698 RepID=UPI000E302B75|nr:hypothetical protein [Mycobacterium uberis]
MYGLAAGRSDSLQHQVIGHDCIRYRTRRALGPACAVWPETVLVGSTRSLLQRARLTASSPMVRSPTGSASMAWHSAVHRHGIPFIVVAPDSTCDTTTATGSEIVVEERTTG